MEEGEIIRILKEMRLGTRLDLTDKAKCSSCGNEGFCLVIDIMVSVEIEKGKEPFKGGFYAFFCENCIEWIMRAIMDRVKQQQEKNCMFG